jgi:hypothetical protein
LTYPFVTNNITSLPEYEATVDTGRCIVTLRSALGHAKMIMDQAGSVTMIE